MGQRALQELTEARAHFTCSPIAQTDGLRRDWREDLRVQGPHERVQQSIFHRYAVQGVEHQHSLHKINGLFSCRGEHL